MKNNEWLNPKNFEKEFGMSLSTQATYRSKKKIPYSKIGGFIYYSRAKIDAWLSQHEMNIMA
ncbi:MAG: helix-turn-helix domain-containing protein [Campylobacterales bacterium]|nr:helix-turn-helix domain-containing protein [Campylobacterales bacterium]